MRAVDGVTDLVWLQTAFLGDVVLTTAAMATARQALRGIRQHVITTAAGAAVLAGEELASRLVLDKRGSGALGAFRDVRAGLRAALPADARPVLLQAHRSPRSSLLARYLRLPTVTYRETRLGCQAAVRVSRVATLHEAARIGLLLEPLGVDRAAIVAARPSLASLPLMNDGDWQERLAHAPYRVVGVAPGSVWATKRWTEEGFVELGARLIAAGVGLALLGSAAEAPLTARLAERLARPTHVLDLAGRTTFDDLRRIYPRLSMLVSGDSSPVHYASAFNVPTVAIFGATAPGMGFGPLAPRSVTVSLPLPCRPCGDHGPRSCPLGHFKCMRDLSATTVLAACMGVLGSV